MKIFLILLLATSFAQAFEVGALSLSGAGCVAASGKQKIDEDKAEASLFKIPLQIQLEKNAALILERKVCQFSLPIKITKSEKIIVSDINQHFKVIADKGAATNLSLSVFAAGVKTKPITYSNKGESDVTFEGDLNHSSEILFESKCGKDVILRGSISVFSQGLAKATIAAQNLYLKIKASTCQ